MTDMTERAAARLAEFEKEKDPETLRAATDLLSEIDLSRETEGVKRLALRRDTLQLWLAVLAQIDKNLDPRFNPEDRPSVSVTPPPVGGTQYPPGVDPSVISDPAARRQYEAAIAQDREKARKHLFQTKLRRVDEKAMPRAERFIRLSYTTVPGDQRELQETVRKLVPNSRRAEALVRAGARKGSEH